MTDCSEARGQLGGYLLGGLERDEANELIAHLAVCRECAASRARLAGVVELIDLAGSPEPPGLPAGFEERLIERATAASPATPPRRQRRRPPLTRRSLGASVAVALAGAAAAMAVLAAVGELGGSSAPPPTRIATIRLVPIGGASHAKAVVYVITRGGHTTLALEASGLPHPMHGKHFIVWLSGRGGSFSAGTIRVTKTGWATAILNSPHLASPGSTIELSIVPTGDGEKRYRTIARGTL